MLKETLVLNERTDSLKISVRTHSVLYKLEVLIILRMLGQNLINDLNNQGEISIPLMSGSKSMKIELNITGEGLVERTYEGADSGEKVWVRGRSKFFNKEQLYNIYKGLSGVPSGGHDNYRKAIVKEMIKSYGLKEYVKGIENSEDNVVPFVLIIDEINRGELSKFSENSSFPLIQVTEVLAEQSLPNTRI